MTDIIATITTALDLAKRIKTTADYIKDSESKLIIADLVSELAEVKIKASDLLTENDKLKREISELKEQARIDLTLKGDVYMAGEDGPFCTTCWDTKKLRVRLKEEIRDFQRITGHKYVCPSCKSRHKGV